MQVAVSIRLYEYEHEQAKLKKKRRNNIFFLLKINMQKESYKKGRGSNSVPRASVIFDICMPIILGIVL